MRSIENLLARFYSRLFASTSIDGGALAPIRIALGLYFLLVVPPFFQKTTSAPQGFFNPPQLSIGYFFDGFPQSGLLDACELAKLACLICLILGVRAVWAGILFVALSVFANSFWYSFGKIDHSILPLLAIACLSFSGWSSRLAVLPDREPKEETRKFALAIYAICLCFAMFTAGFEKGLNWVDFDLSTSGFLRWLYNGYYEYGRTQLLAPIGFYLPPIVVEAFDYAAVAFEISGLVFLALGRRHWIGWISFACLFHLGNTLMLNIPFNANALPYLVFLLPRHYKRTDSQVELAWMRAMAAPVALVAALLLVQWSRGEVGMFLLISDPDAAQLASLSLGTIVWPALVALGCVRLLEHAPSDPQTSVNESKDPGPAMVRLP